MPPKDKIIEPIDASFEDVASAMVATKGKPMGIPAEAEKHSEEVTRISSFETVTFENESGENTAFLLDQETQELWATTEIIAKL